MANQYDTNLKLQAIADAIGNTQSSGLISALEDIADAVAGGGGGGSSTAGLVSDNFSDTNTYDLGDYCIHNNTLYVCINAITTPGPWDLTDWQATNAGIQLASLNSNFEKLLWQNNSPSSAFSAGNINLSSSDYDYLTIYYIDNNADTGYIHSNRVTKGKSITINNMIYSGTNTSPTLMTRDITYASATQYTAGNGATRTGATSSTNNNLCIPLAIYGGKFVTT